MSKSYEQKKRENALRERAKSQKGRDIAPLPKVKARKRRDACAHDLKAFCETYYAEVFHLGWSPDHLAAINVIQESMLNGGLYAFAFPRGSGKTTLCRVAAVWALAYGHRAYVVIFSATEDDAEKLLKTIRMDLEFNDALYQDFPEICYPIRRLERIAHRAAGQTLNGKSTFIELTSKAIVLPTVPGSKASGSRIEVAGLTGSIRGKQANRNNKTIRPDFAMIDDPQTKESAKSPKQIKERLEIIMGDVLGLAGPTKKIAAVCPCTVISKGDVADQLLDRKAHPEWQGTRCKLLKSLPKNVKIWEQYAELRAKSLNEGKGITEATEFYRANREAMDDGAEASWESRYDADEISAIQNAMNLKLRDEAVFAAEYQNEPLSLELDTPLLLKPEQVAAKICDVERGKVPANCSRLTAFIDVQGTVLFYVVVAWANDFTGYVVDYGSYPDQGRNYFFLREVSKTLQLAKPNAAWEGQLYAGLEALCDKLITRKWGFDDGNGSLSVSRLMIDANWGDSTTLVKQFCRESPYSAIVLAAHGRGVTAIQKPYNEYRPEPGVRSGWNWRLKSSGERHILYDTNAWKSFVAQRVLAAKGEIGSLSIFKGSPVTHRMFAEHVTAEYPTPEESMGRQVNIWRAYPNRENHYLDCLVGCYVAASEQGVLFQGHEPSKGTKTTQRRKAVVTF